MSRERLRVGRDVVYRPTDQEAIDGGGSRGDRWTARIARVHADATVNLHVIRANGSDLALFGVDQGSAPGTFSLKETALATAGGKAGGPFVPPPAGGGWIIIEDVLVPGGTASGQVWQDPPFNTVLNEVTVSKTTFTVQVKASFPLVTVAGIDATLTLDANGHYTGGVSVTLTESGDVEAQVQTPDDDDGAVDTVAVTVDAPPAITALTFTGPYPTGPTTVLQTQLKENDQYSIDVTADKPFDQVEVIDFGAGSAGKSLIIPVATGLNAVVQMQAADRGTSTQALPARVRVRDAVTLAFSDTRDTNQGGGTVDGVDLVNLNNTFPGGAFGVVNYPGGQGALKGTESATVNHTATDFDEIAYTDPTGDLTISNPSTFEAAKNVTLTNPGTFNETVDNFVYLMTRHANGAQTTVDDVVLVQDVAPITSRVLPAARLRTGGSFGSAVQDHQITISSDQLLNTPTLDEDSGGGNRGAFQGSWVVSGDAHTYVRDLRCDEGASVLPSATPYAFENFAATNLAGIAATAPPDLSYTIGGFVARTLTFAAFATLTAIGTTVIDFTKLTAGIFTSTSNTALKQPKGTPPSVTDGYTVDAPDTSIVWLDTPAAGANSSGTAQITNVEETV